MVSEHLGTDTLRYYPVILDLAGYMPVPGCSDTIFAAKLTIGSIFNAKRDDIPPPERFYAGTSTLLRGYKYRTVSPLDGKKPIGGRSMVVMSMELRKRFSEDWGGAIFWDVGNVWDTIGPQFNRMDLQSFGCGIRYYTPVGPLRLDIAFPLKRRPNVDSRCQVYFSIGQTF